jgi:hypothetical protein
MLLITSDVQNASLLSDLGMWQQPAAAVASAD